MMKPAYLLMLLAAIIAASCEINTIHPSSKVTTKEFTFNNYTRLEVSGGFVVEVSFSDNHESIEIEANENLHERIMVAENDNTLEIRLSEKTNIKGVPTLKVYISTKSLPEFVGSGLTDITVLDRIVGPSLTVELSDHSFFTGYVTVSNLDVNLSGSSNVLLDGYSPNFYAEASGSSLISSASFACDKFEAELSGGSFAKLTINKEISIVASGASTLVYWGNAVVSYQDLSGGSTIQHNN